MLDGLILGRVALWSGFLILPGIFSDRSSWVNNRFKAPSSIIDAGLYNAVATISGIAALIALAVALNTRPRVVIPVLSLLPAIAVFGLSIYVSGISVWARLQGEIWFYGAWSFAGDYEGYVAHPARGPFIFTFLAVLGAMATLGLALTWLWGDREEQRAMREPISARRAL
ncbi:MAG: hypothetical protein M3Z20_08450 [Chloroflexota bacterium]|nr:hypothetical protein [Chloroflexota bacterium]